jgi:hypothetical protein
LFLFNALALLSIPSKSLKFRSVLFSIPTAPTNISFPDNSSETSPVRTITVSTRADSDSENVKFSVEDTSRGVSPEDKDKLLLPYFSTKGRGTGRPASLNV